MLVAFWVLQSGPAQARHPVRHGYGIYYTTAYLWTGSRTATGVWPYYGGVAVDPSVIPFGALVHSPETWPKLTTSRDRSTA